MSSNSANNENDVIITSVLDGKKKPLPLHGNSLGETQKQSDEKPYPYKVEVLEMADKLKHQLDQQTNLPTVSAGVNVALNKNSNNKAIASNSNSIDEESMKGHFGWFQSSAINQSIPYIYRQSEKFYSVRIVEQKMLSTYLNSLHPEVYSHVNYVNSFFLTKAEATLFNDINLFHCDGQFGAPHFTTKDRLVRQTDVHRFYNYSNTCYRIVNNLKEVAVEKCGFIRINNQNVVCYVEHNMQKMIPIFFFQCKMDVLNEKMKALNGWDLAYLKFSCKLMCLRHELISSESINVISLEDIKSLYPENTIFEVFGPNKEQCKKMIISNKSSGNHTANWTLLPVMPSPKVGAAAGTSTSKKNESH